MTVYTLTTASPTSADITFAEETRTQICVLGGTGETQNSQAQIILEVKDGAEYFDYRVQVPKDEPINYTLAPQTYRLRLTNTASGDLSYKVSVTPNS